MFGIRGLGRYYCGSVVEKNLQSLASVGHVFTVTRAWRDYLVRSDIAGVIIATPPSTHSEIALAFIERGIPVFIEKPMALSSSEAHKILGAAENAGVPVQVGHIHLYNGAYIALKEAVKTYGPIRHIDTEASNFGPYRPDYSVIWDYASHDVSMVLNLLQESPSTVDATAQVLTDAGTHNWDVSNLSLSFPLGITATIISSRIAPTKVRKFTVICEKATLVYDDTLTEKKLAVYESINPESLKKLGAGKATTQALYPDYDTTSPLIMELREFVEVITRKKLPTCDALFGASIVNVLEQAETSVSK